MKDSAIIYESAYQAINYLPDDQLQLEALKGLLEYGFYDTMPESDNPFVNMIYVQAIPSMRNAKERYKYAVENGKKGGRPATVSTEEIIKMKEDGMTNKQIADKIGCSERNIEKRISAYRNNTEQTRTNLSVSVSDTVSESVSSSYTDEDCQKRRRIEDLNNKELEEVYQRYKNREKYIDICDKYNLEQGSLTKDFPKQYEKIKKKREEERKQKEYEENKEYFEELAIYWSCSPEEAQSRYQKTNGIKEYHLEDIVNFLRDHEEYRYDAWYNIYGNKTRLNEYGTDVPVYRYAPFIVETLARELKI